MMFLQKNGNATPSMAASLIERLPDQDDPRRPEEERLAQDVAAISFIGRWQYSMLTTTDSIFYQLAMIR